MPSSLGSGLGNTLGRNPGTGTAYPGTSIGYLPMALPTVGSSAVPVPSFVPEMANSIGKEFQLKTFWQ